MRKRSKELKTIIALYMSAPEFTNLSPRSKKLYINAMKSFSHFLDRRADDITRPMLIDLRDQLYDRPTDCKLAFAVLSNIFNYGYDRGLCSHNHAARMKNMPNNRTIPRWTDEECERFIRGCRPHLRRAFIMALYTGQRRSDLTEILWSHYDGKFITFYQKKTKKFLKVPVHPRLKKELDDMQKERESHKGKKALSPYILNNYWGEKWAPDTLYVAVRDRTEHLGITGRTLHGLRKTCAAKLAEAGCSPSQIKAITGHSSLYEIMRYTQQADQPKLAEEAINLWSAHG